MDTYSSGEDLLIKTRKPYTITKQRERWTEEEHNRFLEALKLYGRAWQRIEEHIGTKTAVQIRSHAQKFFSKLEKEALVKGIPVGQALDIDIPPPRPKRKPSNPYPRKTGAGTPTSQAGGKDGKCLSESFSHCKQVLDLEKEPLSEERPGRQEEATDATENQDDSCSEVLTQLQDTQCSSVHKSSMPKPPVGLTNPRTFRVFVPSLKKLNQDETNRSYLTIELDGNRKLEKTDSKEMTVQDIDMMKGSKLENTDALQVNVAQGDLNSGVPTEEMQTSQNYPRHVPVHVLDRSHGTCIQTPSDMPFREPIFHPEGEVGGHPKVFTKSAASGTTEHKSNASSVHQSYPAFHPPFTPIHNQEDYNRSLHHMSSTFSGLIVSTLLQNPAAHAAASFAATFWPYANAETSADSPAGTQGGFSPSQINSTPSMAAIAAATVAAATAWWAAHGMLPLCAPPLPTAFTCNPASTSGIPSMDTDQAPEAKTEKVENSLNPPLQGPLDVELTEALQAQNAASKSPTVSSDSEESGGVKPNSIVKEDDHENAAATTEIQDSNKEKNQKLVDRSSCGSNTASSSEVETDALEKQGNEKEEEKEQDTNQPGCESNSRRSRITTNLNDSWKEVSEEGRLAFQALFAREVLPQSFSPPQMCLNYCAEVNKQKEEEKNGDATLLDLNRKMWVSCSNNQELEKNEPSRSDNNLDVGLLTIGLGLGKLKTRRTGFKPYKRCSVEAKEDRVGNDSIQNEEKCPKRLRLEGEAST
ncbi:hypothetical protein UlMin_021826 [Ulmus minor]